MNQAHLCKVLIQVCTTQNILWHPNGGVFSHLCFKPSLEYEKFSYGRGFKQFFYLKLHSNFPISDLQTCTHPSGDKGETLSRNAYTAGLSWQPVTPSDEARSSTPSSLLCMSLSTCASPKFFLKCNSAKGRVQKLNELFSRNFFSAIIY